MWAVNMPRNLNGYTIFIVMNFELSAQIFIEFTDFIKWQYTHMMFIYTKIWSYDFNIQDVANPKEWWQWGCRIPLA